MGRAGRRTTLEPRPSYTDETKSASRHVCPALHLDRREGPVEWCNLERACPVSTPRMPSCTRQAAACDGVIMGVLAFMLALMPVNLCSNCSPAERATGCGCILHLSSFRHSRVCSCVKASTLQPSSLSSLDRPAGPLLHSPARSPRFSTTLVRPHHQAAERSVHRSTDAPRGVFLRLEVDEGEW